MKLIKFIYLEKLNGWWMRFDVTQYYKVIIRLGRVYAMYLKIKVVDGEMMRQSMLLCAAQLAIFA